VVDGSHTTSPIREPSTKANMLANTSKSMYALTGHVSKKVLGKTEFVEAKKLELRSMAKAFNAQEKSKKEKKMLFANEKI
jgi:hypothetical protein